MYCLSLTTERSADNSPIIKFNGCNSHLIEPISIPETLNCLTLPDQIVPDIDDSFILLGNVIDDKITVAGKLVIKKNKYRARIIKMY